MSARRSKLGVSVGDQYALLPLEVAESIAWNGLPDYAARVLTALQLEYRGHNNGCLGLTASQAQLRGVHHQWKLYAGLKVLSLACLIVCTRRGKLIAGTKLPSLYAITWKGIDEPRDGVAYDVGISVCPIPRHDWTKWQKPDDWLKTCQRIAREMHGRGKKNPVSTTVGEGRSTTVGAKRRKAAPNMVEKERQFAAPSMVETSKTSPGGCGAGLPARAPPRVSRPRSAHEKPAHERMRADSEPLAR